ncbi:MAG TPA: hypothetical protein VGO73_11220, partial [Pyrinomonadaceae bacterium]|nr:hypothetical protein [Pyrinomonadaceae bacterium]
EIERLAKSSPDIEISHDGYLSVSLEFVRDAFKLIEPLLLDLARRTDQELRAKGVSDKHPIEQSH